MEILKIIVIRLAVLAIGTFWSSFALFLLAWNWIQRGNELWHVKERKLPPKCLQDPALGRHSMINLKDVKLHYVENGDRNKPLMLFVHGFPEFWFSWRHQIKHFYSDYWVVAIDLRGYGDSDKPSGVNSYHLDILEQDICQLIKALGKEHCTLVAHDWGGIIAWTVAARNPKLIEKLVIMNGPHPTAFRKTLICYFEQFLKSWYAFAYQVPYLPEIWHNTDDLECFKHMFAAVDKSQRLTDEELDAYKYTFSKEGAWSWTPPMNYYRSILSGSSILHPPYLPKITVPTLLIWGDHDVALSKNLPEITREFVNDLQIKYIKDANHFVQQDKPDDVNQAIEQFIK